MRRYYTVVTKVDGLWQPQFGDYERAVAAEEMRSMSRPKRLIASGDAQCDIDEVITTLNRENVLNELFLAIALEVQYRIKCFEEGAAEILPGSFLTDDIARRIRLGLTLNRR